MMISIIIPYYKISFFEDCLQSLADQTDKRFKVYIGDDASSENPTLIVAKFKGLLDLVYHRFDVNLGGKSLVQQWERCIALSNKEEWLMILGDDDVLSPTCIAEFYNKLPEIEEVRCSVVRFATEVIDEENKSISSIYTHPKIENATDFFYRKLTNKTRSSLSEYLFKRTAYDRFGFYNYNLAWYADDRAWLEFSEFQIIYSINSAFVKFRISEENISRGNYKTKEKEVVKLQFFKFIVSKCLYEFNQVQQRHLLLYYEQLIYRNKKVTFGFWFFILVAYLKQLRLIQALKFSRRILIHLRNNER